MRIMKRICAVSPSGPEATHIPAFRSSALHSCPSAWRIRDLWWTQAREGVLLWSVSPLDGTMGAASGAKWSNPSSVVASSGSPSCSRLKRSTNRDCSFFSSAGSLEICSIIPIQKLIFPICSDCMRMSQSRMIVSRGISHCKRVFTTENAHLSILLCAICKSSGPFMFSAFAPKRAEVTCRLPYTNAAVSVQPVSSPHTVSFIQMHSLSNSPNVLGLMRSRSPMLVAW